MEYAVVEVMGWLEGNPTRVNIRYWDRVGRICGVNDCVVIRGRGLSRGAGAGNDSSYLLVEAFTNAKRAFMSQDIIGNKSNKAAWSTRRKILQIVDQGNPVCQIRDKESPWSSLIPEQFNPGQQRKVLIFTDGSYRKSFGGIEHIFDYGKDTGIASSGVVVMCDGETWRESTIMALQIGPLQGYDIKSFGAEIIAAAVGACLGSTIGCDFEIVTDCHALYNNIQVANVKDFSKKPNMSALQTIALNCVYTHQIRWTRSHPEGRQERSAWSQDDYGIFMADRVAAGDWNQVEQCAKVERVHISMDRVMKWLGQEDRWHWIDKEGLNIMDTIEARVRRRKIEDYTEARDEYRRKRGDTPI